MFCCLEFISVTRKSMQACCCYIKTGFGLSLFKSIHSLSDKSFMYLIEAVFTKKVCCAFYKLQQQIINVLFFPIYSERRICLVKPNTYCHLTICNGSETWPLKTGDIQSLGVFERRILRAIYGPTKEGDEWRIGKKRNYMTFTRTRI
jgi:hypothetical protein